MGRPRGFVEETVLDAAVEIFVAGGYEGTSIDDLVTGLKVHRGSLYKAFGSKRGLFLAVLEHYVRTRLTAVSFAGNGRASIVEDCTHGGTLDLLLVAALERGPRDEQVAALVRRALAHVEVAVADPADGGSAGPCELPPSRALALLGARLFARLHDSVQPAPHSTAPSKTAKEI